MSPVRWAFNTCLWVNSFDNWKRCLSAIQPEEVARLSEFVFQNSAVSSLMGRLLLRFWASHCLHLPWKSIKFARTDKGRPYLVWPDTVVASRDVDVNVSHQGDWVVLAAEQSAKVGVDIMKIEYSGGKSVQEFFRLMQRQFTSVEWTAITTGEDELTKLAAFYRHWCLKESVVKALGVGIGFDLQKVSFQTFTSTLSKGIVVKDTVVAIEGVSDTRWRFEECKLGDEYCVAVALLPIAGEGTRSNSYPKHEHPKLVAQNDSLSCEPINSDSVLHSTDASNSSGCFQVLGLEDILDGIEEFSAVSDELVEQFMMKEKAAWL